MKGTLWTRAEPVEVKTVPRTKEKREERLREKKRREEKRREEKRREEKRREEKRREEKRVKTVPADFSPLSALLHSCVTDLHHTVKTHDNVQSDRSIPHLYVLVVLVGVDEVTSFPKAKHIRIYLSCTINVLYYRCWC